jgi:hypothetical protein
MPEIGIPTGENIFSGSDVRVLEHAVDRMSRKPNGSQDQGRKDEND